MNTCSIVSSSESNHNRLPKVDVPLFGKYMLRLLPIHHTHDHRDINN